jgi:hypothetical protein
MRRVVFLPTWTKIAYPISIGLMIGATFGTFFSSGWVDWVEQGIFAIAAAVLLGAMWTRIKFKQRVRRELLENKLDPFDVTYL